MRPLVTFLSDKNQTLALAATASKFSRRPSELVGIVDESVGLAFDMECSNELMKWEVEREQKMIEAMVGGSIQNQLPPELRARVEKPGPRRIRQ